jgi:hypothetical protein
MSQSMVRLMSRACSPKFATRTIGLNAFVVSGVKA